MYRLEEKDTYEQVYALLTIKDKPTAIFISSNLLAKVR